MVGTIRALSIYLRQKFLRAKGRLPPLNSTELRAMLGRGVQVPKGTCRSCSWPRNHVKSAPKPKQLRRIPRIVSGWAGSPT